MNVSSMLSDQNRSEAERHDEATALSQAINSANLERVRKVLVKICAEIPQAHDMACADLLLPRKRDVIEQRYENCKQCKKKYEVAKNTNDACVWHPDSLDVDRNAECFGDLYDGDMTPGSDLHDECPEGFVWSCCEKSLDVAGPGCRIDLHRPQSPQEERTAKILTPPAPLGTASDLTNMEPQWYSTTHPATPAQGDVPEGFDPEIWRGAMNNYGNGYASPLRNIHAAYAMAHREDGQGTVNNGGNA